MMSAYTGKRFVNPLNKNIGRRTGRDFRAGKKIRVGNDGFENFDDYFSESDAEVTREYSRRHASTIREESESAGTQESCSDDEYKENQPSYSNTVSQSMPNATLSNATCNNITSSQSLSQGGQNRSKFGWLRNRDIGRRTGKNITANKQIRIDEQGFENFDDYLSESDVSSLSSRLSVSVVKPIPRHSAVSNLVVGDATPSVTSGSQGSQENSTTDDDDGSQGDGTDSQTELREDSQTRSSNLEHDTHYKTTDSKIEDETFTLEKNKTPSIHKHTDESEIEKVDKSGQPGHVNELSVYDETEEQKSKEETSVYQLTQSKNVKPQHVDTPLSSRRSRSKLSVAIDEYPDRKSSYDNRQENNTNKVTEQSSNDSDELNEPGRHKICVKSRISEKKSRSIELYKVSIGNSEHFDTKHNSEDETEIDKQQVNNDNVAVVESDNDDMYNEDTEEKEDSRNIHDENDSENTGSDKGGEESDIDNESDAYVIEKEKNNADYRKGENTGNNTVQNVQKKSRETESLTENKTVSKHETEAEELSDSGECLSEDVSKDDEEEDDDDDELRPSQAHTNIDVAGNRSGSITKLDIPTSVVSFNRTRKRLSYSAGEASGESSQRNRSRIEKANAELFETKQMLAPKEVKANLSAVSIKDKSKNAADIKVKKIWDSEPTTEESSDFLSLASRSTYPQQTYNADFHADDEDDIEILDYEKPKVTGESEKNKNAKNKTRRQTKSTDTDSHSDSNKQEKSKNVKQGSKSEIKKTKSKDNRKGRRKTTHDSGKVNGITVNSRKGTKKLELDSENQILNTDVNDEKLIVDGDNMTVKVMRNESDKTVNRNRLKDKQQSNKSCNSKENVNKSKKKSKSQSDFDIADETETKNAHFRNTYEPSEVLNEDEGITGDCEATEDFHRKQTNRKGSKKANKREISSGESSHSVKEGENSRKRKLIQKEIQNSSKNGLSNESESDCTENHLGGKFVKKQKGKPLRQSQISKCEANIEYVHDDKLSQDEKIVNKSLKRKSSSDDCIEDNEEAEFQTKKTRKSKGTVRSKGRRKNSKQKSSGSSSSDNGEGIHTANIDSNPDLDELGKRTPAVDTRLSAPLHFGSGVSFRVSRRSELLEDIGSGYIGEGDVRKQPAGALTPCISRPGGARKSKGRRVTICPEENIEHNISGNKSSDENSRSSSHFRSSTGTSGNSTPLPDPDSTPVHFAETTHTATPHPGKAEESVIEDRLIKPSPPEEGLRRSQRTRLKPIAWYKNEQIVFDYRRRSGPAIIGVKPSLEVKWNQLEEQKRKKRLLRNQIRNASRKVNEEKPYRKLSIHKQLPKDIEVDEDQESEITVFNQNIQAEAGIDCIGKRDAYKPVGPTYETPNKEDPFVITKLLDHPCMTAGKLHIKPNAEKPEQIVVGDYTVFFIEYGKVLVTVHKTSFLVETGDTFMVPVGNTYSISNLRADTAKLFYTVHKQVDYNDKSADGSATELT